MSHLITSRVEKWYAANRHRFSQLFDVFNLRLMFAEDDKRGKVTIEIDGRSVGANITFWNKGDVMALLLNKSANKEYKLDDRKLAAADKVETLLDSYMRRAVEESQERTIE